MTKEIYRQISNAPDGSIGCWGAIKGQHFDIYQGIGHEAGQAAGFYNHYGRVWVLKNAQSSGPLFTAYKGGTQSEPASNDSSLLVNNQDR